MRNGFPSFTPFFAVAALISLAMPVMAQGFDYDIETIALSGDPAPDVLGGTFSTSFSPPDLNDAGDVAFRTFLEQDPALNGVWVGPPGNLRLVALSGEEPPGAPGREFASFSRLSVNEEGEVVFQALLDKSQPFNNGIWAGAPGALAAVARGGELAPDAEPRTFSVFSQGRSPTTAFDPVINNFGEVVITGFLDASDTTNDEGIWAGLPGTISLVVRKGDLAPDTAEVFRATRNPDLNDNGEIVFRGTLETDPVTQGLWFGTLGAITALALEDDPAPGAPGRTFHTLGPQPYLNNAGKVAFRASLDHSDISNSLGIWGGTPGNLQLLVHEGATAPATSGKTFKNFSEPVFNEAGGIAFYGELDVADAASNEGIWAGQGGNIQLVAREGMEAPGAPGRAFGRLIPVRPALNDLGEVAFGTNLDASDTSNDHGIWVGAPGSLQLLVREGDVLEVRPGDFRTVTLADLLGDHHVNGVRGRQTGFNASGQVALMIGFADGSSGIFLATPLRADLWLEQRARRIGGGIVRLTLTVHSAAGSRAAEPEVCGFGATTDAENVVLIDHLPLTPERLEVVSLPPPCAYQRSTHTVTCRAPLFPRDFSVSLVIEGRLIDAAGDLVNVVNTATISSDTFDPNPDNNTVTFPRTGN